MYEIEKPSARIAAAMARNECPSRCISTMQSIAASRPEQFDQLALGADAPAEGNDTAEVSVPAAEHGIRKDSHNRRYTRPQMKRPTSSASMLSEQGLKQEKIHA